MPSRCLQRAVVRAPAQAEHFDVARVRLEQPLEDLDGRRLAGAVRAEQAEALARPHLEVEARDGHDVAIALVEPAAQDRRRKRCTRSVTAAIVTHLEGRSRFC